MTPIARSGPVRASGFTLIEMLVVLAIAGLIAGIGFPSIDHAIDRQRFHRAADDVARTLWTARADAIRSGRAIVVIASADGRTIGFKDGVTAVIDDDIRLEMPRQGIGFFADGTSTGGVVRLVAARSARVMRIAPVTGSIVKS